MTALEKPLEEEEEYEPRTCERCVVGTVRVYRGKYCDACDKEITRRILRLAEDMDHGEIAGMFGLSRDAVDHRISRAKKRLKRTSKGDVPAPLDDAKT